MILLTFFFQIDNFTGLKQLDLGFNRLTEIPSSIRSLPSLQIVKLTGNQLTEQE